MVSGTVPLSELSRRSLRVERRGGEGMRVTGALPRATGALPRAMHEHGHGRILRETKSCVDGALDDRARHERQRIHLRANQQERHRHVLRAAAAVLAHGDLRGRHRIVERLQLVAHPEGGFYKETYRASLTVDYDGASRSASTAARWGHRSAQQW